jgi:anti-sigma regulatory factor (Ser/Thr protein kinase)
VASQGLVFDRILPAVRSSVGVARRGVDGTLHRLGAPDQLRMDVALVVSEAVSNVVMHAYIDRPRGPLYVAAVVDDDAVVIVVGDAGRGLRPRLESPGMGYGLPLMGQLCDDLAVAVPSEGAGTILTATFRHAMPPAPGEFDRTRHDSLKEYVQALLDSSNDGAYDARALVAEADQAMREGEQIRRAFLRAG